MFPDAVSTAMMPEAMDKGSIAQSAEGRDSRLGVGVLID